MVRNVNSVHTIFLCYCLSSQMFLHGDGIIGASFDSGKKVNLF